MAESKKAKFYYFDALGRGELPRFVLSYNGIEFEDVRVPKPEWAEWKKDNNPPFGASSTGD